MSSITSSKEDRKKKAMLKTYSNTGYRCVSCTILFFIGVRFFRRHKYNRPFLKMQPQPAVYFVEKPDFFQTLGLPQPYPEMGINKKVNEVAETKCGGYFCLGFS